MSRFTWIVLVAFIIAIIALAVIADRQNLGYLR